MSTGLMSAQSDSTQLGVGLNFVPLYSGTPELQLDYFPFKSWGLSSGFGYTYKPVRGGFILVDDDAEIHSLKGYYLKIGLKFRKTLASKHAFTWFGQISYIFSAYDETGKSTASIDTAQVINYKGFVNGIAATSGFELRVIRFVHFRAGLQLGTYSRRHHLGYPGHSFQPGIGASGQIFNNQVHAGLVLKIGRVGR